MTNDSDYIHLLVVARNAIRDHLNGSRASNHDQSVPEPTPSPKGAFVTLLTPEGDLRGCIGRHARMHPDNLHREIADCAILAATQDPRFPPVEAVELDRLILEISLIHEQEPIGSVAELDPRKFGVIVTSGRRSGTLLPDLEGVDTVEKQISIAMRKAGILPGEPVQLKRFLVTKVRR